MNLILLTINLDNKNLLRNKVKMNLNEENINMSKKLQILNN